jgi:hypothetical protein
MRSNSGSAGVTSAACRGCETPAGEVAEGFDRGMDLRGQPAAEAANRPGPFSFGAGGVLIDVNHEAVHVRFLDSGIFR